MKKTSAFIMSIIILIYFCGCGLTVTETDNESTESEVVTLESMSSQTWEDQSDESATDPTFFVSEKTLVTQVGAATVSPVTTKSTSNGQTTEKTSSTVKKTTGTTAEQVTCTIEISCETILNNLQKLKAGKREFVPDSGMILNKTKITVTKGSTVFDVLQKACKNNKCADSCKYCTKSGIQMEYVYTPAYSGNYIRGIHQLYEKDCGTRSGWMYSVNGIFPNDGVSKYTVKNGDVIRFAYTCDLGEDVGG